jgi:hypothetical protein
LLAKDLAQQSNHFGFQNLGAQRLKPFQQAQTIRARFAAFGLQ